MRSGMRADAVASEALIENNGRLRLQLIAVRTIAIVVLTISITALGSGYVGVDVIGRVVAPSDRLSFNASCAFLLLGILLLLGASSARSSSVTERTSRRRRIWIRALAVLVALIGFLTLVELALGVHLSIDALIVGHDPDPRTRYAGRMSVLSAVSVIVLSAAFFISTIRARTQLASILALMAFLFGYVALLGYVYGAEQLYRIGPIAMPLESAACVVLVASACLLLPPYLGFMRPVASSSAGGVLLRRLLPVALFVAPAVDWVQARAARDVSNLGMALVGAANVVLLVVLVWGTGRAVYLAQRQRLLAEASLRRANDALVRSNIELRRFTHVAAHDLQTPLRGIGGFAELLKEHYADRLDRKGEEWLERILNAALHMQALVRDLLTYSRIETQKPPTARVQMDQVLDQTVLLLESEIQDTAAVITRTKLPLIVGDATQLVQLLLNLLQNAIKYRSAAAPRVQVAAERRGDEWVFSVTDNGIGIEPRYAERIFEMFERLHNAQEYQGTGIGLAICRRVVQRHGGDIWVESQPGQGSTFFFTLPVAPEEP